MQATAFRTQQVALIARVTPYAMAGHIVNTTVLAVALVGSVPREQLVIWCAYSYAIALFLLYRRLKGRGRSPANVQRAAKRAAIYALFLALSWSSLAVLHLGTLSYSDEIVLVALTIGMAASGTVLLSALPLAALIYMSGILIPCALKFFILNQKSYSLLGVLTLSCWAFLAALIAKIRKGIQERERAEQALAERNLQLALAGKAALVGSYAYDSRTDQVQISPGYAAIHGLPDGTTEISRDQWLAFVHPDDLERLQVFRKGALRERPGEYKVDYRIVRNSREVRWIETRGLILYGADGRPDRLIGVKIDVTDRKLTEAALQASEAKFSNILAIAGDAIISMDADYRITLFNEAAERVFGYSQTEVFGQPIDLLIPTRFHLPHQQYLGRIAFGPGLLRRMNERNEVTGRRKNGEEFPSEASISVRDVDGQRFFTAVLRDVTDRKLAEHALAERNLQLALAGKAGQVGTFAYDVETERMQISEGYAAIYGLPEGTTEIPRSDWQARVHPEDLERLEDLRRRAFVEGLREYAIDYRVVRPDRGERWIDSRSFISYTDKGQPQRVVGVNIDVTQRKIIEHNLAERQAQLELANTIAQVGSYTYNYSTGSLCHGPGSASIYGLRETAEETTADEWRKCVHPEDLARLVVESRQALARQQRELVCVFRILRHGEVRWIETRNRFYYDETGRATQAVGASIDVTERKRVEETQNILNAELDHRVKNALATVSAVVSHTQQGSRSVAEFAAALEGRIRSMATTHELLSARRWAGISLAEIVERELLPYATRNNTAIGGPEVILPAEVGQAMAMVLHELATNAAKYGALSTKKGRVSVRWDRPRNGHLETHLLLEWRESGGPPVVAPGNTSYGTSTVRDLIPYEFGGIVDLAFEPDGVRCRLEIPGVWLSNSAEPPSEPAAANL